MATRRDPLGRGQRNHPWAQWLLPGAGDGGVGGPLLLWEGRDDPVLDHARDPIADEYRAEIARRYGERAVVQLALALVASQMYPTFKYALGYGHACSRIVVEGTAIVPKLATA